MNNLEKDCSFRFAPRHAGSAILSVAQADIDVAVVRPFSSRMERKRYDLTTTSLPIRYTNRFSLHSESFIR